jgi:uncharacterized protein (TIGR03083 family)
VDHAAALTEQNRLLAQLYRTADPEIEVPTCPGWTVRKLVTHVGRGDRWAATIVRERSSSYVDVRTVAGGRPPDNRDGVADWLGAGADELLAAVATVGADAPVWTFVGPQPARWWIRRRLHEATVHRADAVLALGGDYELPAELAADGLSEWLDLIAARPVADAPVPLDVGATLHLHATDPDLGEAGEWFLRAEPGGVTWEHGHRKGQAAVRGRAVDLLLAALRRIPADDGRLEVLGDGVVWSTWLDRTGF